MWARAFRLLGIVVVSVYLGYLIGSNWVEPEVTVPQPPKIIGVEVPVEVVREVEVIKEVEVVREVEVIKEVPVKLRNFESVQELKDWLQQVDRRIRLKANSEGIIQLQGVCEDVAMYVQDRAIEDGYKMSIEVLSKDEYHRWYGEWLNEGRLHAVNSAITGNEFWFIDFSSDKVWLAAYLDD